MRIRRKKTLIQQAADYVEAAVEKAGPILADAKDRAEEVLADAREHAAPALADVKDQAMAAKSQAMTKAAPAMADVREKAAPLIAQGMAMAAEKASSAADAAADMASQGKEVAAARAAELVGKPKKKHRLRTLFIVTGIAALLGFALKKFRDNAEEDDWQSSYTPEPTPAPRASAPVTDTPIADAAAAAQTDGADEGGAGPDEALADATEESHEVTTPDEPADVVEVSPGEEPVAKKSAKP
jgi:hypothetical protein